MKAHPRQILASLESQEGTGSVAAKKKIVEEHLDVPEFVKTVEYALNPFKQYYTTTIPGLAQISTKARQDDKAAKKGMQDLFEEDEKWPWKKQFEKMFDLLDDMSSQKLPPNSGQSRAAVLEWAKHCGAGTIDVFRRIINKDLKCGMTENSFNKIKPGWVPTFKCQLAQPFDQAKLKFPCYVDPKYDGVRTLAFVDTVNGTVIYMSRNGLQFQNFDCFSLELAQLFKSFGPAVVADCEVINEKGFQTLMKMPKFKDPNFETTHLRCMVFDLMPTDAFKAADFDMVQKRRLEELALLFKGQTLKQVCMVPTRMAKDFTEVEQIFEFWVAQGLEGVIMKQPDAKYEFKRTYSWQKLKPSKSKDLRIVGMELGEGKREGKCGKLIVEHDAGHKGIVRVGVGSGLSDWEVDNIKEDNGQILYRAIGSEEWINIKGQIVEVTYDCETDDGSLRFPRIKRRGDSIIRTDK
jgi:DNA ligase-1